MKRVIIDDGVYPGAFRIPNITEHLMVKGGGQIVRDSSPPVPFSHGSQVAAIMEQLAPGHDFVSLRVLDRDGRGDTGDLVQALAWCQAQGVKLIHMSMGSADCRDFPAIREAVRPLVKKGGLAVAAYHNLNIPSYPAFCPGVFGVRHAREAGFPDGTFAFDRTRVLRLENALIARFEGPLVSSDGTLHPTRLSNSFAAPVITAQLCKLLDKNPGWQFSQAFSALERDAFPADCHEKFLEFEPAKVSAPVLAVQGKECALQLEKRFMLEGYHVLLLADWQGAIPKSLYCPNGKAQPGLFGALEKIYTPDLILYILDEEEGFPDEVDAAVCAEPMRMVTLSGETVCKGVDDLFQAIQTYFS